MADKIKISQTEEEWRQQLSPEQYQVCRAKGTEKPFSGKHYTCADDGIYSCVCCGTELFSSEAKFDSGTGWPSFTMPLEKGYIRTENDDRLGLRRTEVLCRNCDAHLGHVFADGPQPTGQRYCINSIAMDFEPSKAAQGKVAQKG